MTTTRRRLLQISAASIATGGVAALISMKGSPVPVVGEAQAQSAEELLAPGPLPEKAVGDENAPVTIIEYYSMTCPHCASFHLNTFPAIKEKYIDSGQARIVFREFPFDARAAAASMLMRCADESRYLPMKDVLFQQQRNWSRAPDARPPLLQIAKLAGFTQESFEACLKNQDLLDKIGQIRNKAANEYGVNSTPTFFINGTKYAGNMSVEEMSGIIDDLL